MEKLAILNQKVSVNGHCYFDGEYVHVSGQRVLKQDSEGLYVKFKGKRIPVKPQFGGEPETKAYIVDDSFENGKYNMLGSLGNVPMLELSTLKDI